MKGFPELEGLHYKAARRAFDRAVICGYQDAAGQLHVNPDEDAVLQAGDRVIALAQTGESKILESIPKNASHCLSMQLLADHIQWMQPLLAALDSIAHFNNICISMDAVHAVCPNHCLHLHLLAGFFKPSLPEKDEVRQEVEAADMVMQSTDGPADLHKIIPKHIIVAWWDQDITDLARSLAIFAPNGSSVTVICSSKPEGFPSDKARFLNPGCRFVFQEGDPASAEQLRKAGADRTQAIIVGGLQSRPAKEADALTISVILLLQEVLTVSGRDTSYPAHIVGMVRSPETVEVANYLIDRLGKATVTAELLHPDELVSGILSQVAGEPDMANLLAGFIYTTEASLAVHVVCVAARAAYQLPEDTPISFVQVAELCRHKRETAIGYITASAAAATESSQDIIADCGMEGNAVISPQALACAGVDYVDWQQIGSRDHAAGTMLDPLQAF
ncbi:hypothetical protein MMC07_006825 [Pseudocyphellaria aurata]|nr:hypothetical protein [Pseudocyphellaria aurata]